MVGSLCFTTASVALKVALLWELGLRVCPVSGGKPWEEPAACPSPDSVGVVFAGVSVARASQISMPWLPCSSGPEDQT